MKQRILIGFVLVSCLARTCNGTAIFIVSHAGSVYIATDTLLRVPGSGLADMHACKVYASDKYALAISGTLGTVVVDRSFSGQVIKVERVDNLSPKIIPIMKQPGDPATKIAKLKEVLAQAQNENQANNPGSPIQMIQANLFWFSNQKLMLKQFGFAPQRDGSFRPLDHPPVTPPQDIPIALDLKRSFDDPRQPQLRAYSTDPLGSLTKLLTLESTLSKNDVGPPFAILKFGPVNSEWVTPATVCDSQSFITKRKRN
jgi:hypothetical protein